MSALVCCYLSKEFSETLETRSLVLQAQAGTRSLRWEKSSSEGRWPGYKEGSRPCGPLTFPSQVSAVSRGGGTGDAVTLSPQRPPFRPWPCRWQPDNLGLRCVSHGSVPSSANTRFTGPREKRTSGWRTPQDWPGRRAAEGP